MHTLAEPAPGALVNDSPAVAFDALLEMARSGAVVEALGHLVGALAEARARYSPEAWFRTIAQARAHPLRELLHRDPFTLRCYAKPRGYAADATALDYVLRARELTARQDEAASIIHHFTTHGQTARALCFRRDCLADEIDAAASHAEKPVRVFAAGCGHLRECDRVRSFGTGRIGKLVGFDMDAENLDGLRRDYPQLPIVAHQGSVRQLIEGKHLFGDMDLVYCSGLMESMSQSGASALARALFAMLRPGGTLLVTCFSTGLAEAGYLEAYMDWRMVYRTQSEALALVKELDADAVSSWTCSVSPESTLAVVRVTRRF